MRLSLRQVTVAEITGDTDTTIVDAPGETQHLEIYQMAIGVNLVGTAAAIEFEDGVDGDIVFSYLASAGGGVICFPEPLRCSKNTLLNAATKGGAVWNITVWYKG